MKNNYTNNILTAGLILGVLYSAFSMLPYLFSGATWAVTLFYIGGFGVIAWGLFFYGKKAADIKDLDNAGYSYGQAFGFSVMALALSGVIIGLSSWLLNCVIDPAYFEAEFQKNLSAQPNLTDEAITAAMKMRDYMQNPIILVLASTISMIFMGGIVALITSALVSRKPKL